MEIGDLVIISRPVYASDGLEMGRIYEVLDKDSNGCVKVKGQKIWFAELRFERVTVITKLERALWGIDEHRN